MEKCAATTFYLIRLTENLASDLMKIYNEVISISVHKIVAQKGGSEIKK